MSDRLDSEGPLLSFSWRVILFWHDQESKEKDLFPDQIVFALKKKKVVCEQYPFKSKRTGYEFFF